MKISQKDTEHRNTLKENITKSGKISVSEIGKMICRRCSGRMKFEIFYGPGDPFCGLRCLLCGDILDPVILLHRLSRNPQIPIPKHGYEIIFLIRKYMVG